MSTRLSSDLLFKQQNKVIIEHLGEEYVLRITRSGKLILTK
ncbi:MAG: hemin uptake protein HemP [Methylomarinum sp.]|nr:hemin uptake protein HemP [Methylomarinum sp.]